MKKIYPAVALLMTSITQAAEWPEVMIHLHGSGKAFLVAGDKVTATLETGEGGTLGTVTPDGSKLYVGNAAADGDTVTAIDLQKHTVTARIPTGNRPKHPLASPDGRYVVVNHWGLDNGALRVSFIDTATDKVAKAVDIPVHAEPVGVTSMHNAWSLDSKQVFTVDRVDSQLVVIDSENWQVREIDVPSSPHYPVPSPDGKELWLIHEGNAAVKPGIIIYALPDLSEITRLDMPLMGEEVMEAHHGNFTQDGRHFMALNRGPGKDARGREVAVFDAAGKKLLHRITTASNGVGHAYNTPDGKYAVITNYGNNVITILDTTTWCVAKDLQIGTGRMGHVAFTPDSRYAYVSNNGDGNLHKLDMQTLSVVAEIPTGNAAGGGQVLNIWTNVFEELPR